MEKWITSNDFLQWFLEVVRGWAVLVVLGCLLLH